MILMWGLNVCHWFAQHKRWLVFLVCFILANLSYMSAKYGERDRWQRVLKECEQRESKLIKKG